MRRFLLAASIATLARFQPLGRRQLSTPLAMTLTLGATIVCQGRRWYRVLRVTRARTTRNARIG